MCFYVDRVNDLFGTIAGVALIIAGLGNVVSVSRDLR